MVNDEIYEATIRELGLRLAQAEIDLAFATSRVRHAQETLRQVLVPGTEISDEALDRLQNLVVTLAG